MSRALKRKNSALWLALRFSDLSLHALGLQNREEPFVVADKDKVFYATQNATNKGVHIAMNLTTAHLLSGGEPLFRDEYSERQIFQSVVADMYQFTPYIEEYIHGHEYGVLLELSQCLLLFGGVQALGQKICGFLNNKGYRFSYGLAHSAKAAWLLSYKAYPIHGQETRSLFIERLKEVPLQYLYEFPKELEQLEKSGFKCLGDVVKQLSSSRVASLSKRYSPDFVRWMQEAFDIGNNLQQKSLFEAPKKQYQQRDFFLESLHLEYPVALLEQLKPALELLLGQLEKYLVQRQGESKKIIWFFYNIHGKREELAIYCEYPQMTTVLFYNLSCIKLEAQGLPFEIDDLELSCDSYTVVGNRSRRLSFDGVAEKQDGEESLSLALAKLKMFLPPNAISQVTYENKHVPEKSSIAVEFSSEPKLNAQNYAVSKHAFRPTWLFINPYAISVKKQGLYWEGYISLLSKEERIESDWWSLPVNRDYFLARRDDNLYLWVFMDRNKAKWYVQGVFA